MKQALAGGDMELVEELLGYPYEVGGIVQHGQRLGRRLGMPTVRFDSGSRKAATAMWRLLQ